jgi:hypothetical protein
LPFKRKKKQNSGFIAASLYYVGTVKTAILVTDKKPGDEMHQGVVSAFSIFFSKYAKKVNICMGFITGIKIKTKKNKCRAPQPIL